MSVWFIEYNRWNNERARKMRRMMTRAESRIWFTIFNSRPKWYKFLRQKCIKWFILDFYCSKLLLCIEIDGSSHNDRQEYDKQREQYLSDIWILTIRYTNDEVIEDIDWVFENIIKNISEREISLNIVPW